MRLFPINAFPDTREFPDTITLLLAFARTDCALCFEWLDFFSIIDRNFWRYSNIATPSIKKCKAHKFALMLNSFPQKVNPVLIWTPPLTLILVDPRRLVRQTAFCDPQVPQYYSVLENNFPASQQRLEVNRGVQVYHPRSALSQISRIIAA